MKQAGSTPDKHQMPVEIVFGGHQHTVKFKNNNYNLQLVPKTLLWKAPLIHDWVLLIINPRVVPV